MAIVGREGHGSPIQAALTALRNAMRGPTRGPRPHRERPRMPSRREVLLGPSVSMSIQPAAAARPLASPSCS